jgi:hypothetical protein
MQESTTYQKILREGRKEGQLEGRIAEAQCMLLRQGRKKFHDPDPATVAALEAINDLERLETMGERILDSEIRDWTELLETA